MNIFLIRHGKDNSNYRGGWNELTLVDEGIEQSKLLAGFFKFKQDEYNINKIISSDLVRAKQTAEIINEQLNIPIEYTKELREINNGEIAGMLNEIVEKNYPGLYFNTLRMDEKYPQGESPIEFFERIKTYFYNLLKNHNSNDNIMLVTHSGVINIIYCIVKNIEWSNKIKAQPVESALIYKLIIEKYKDIKFEIIKTA